MINFIKWWDWPTEDFHSWRLSQTIEDLPVYYSTQRLAWPHHSETGMVRADMRQHENLAKKEELPRHKNCKRQYQPSLQKSGFHLNSFLVCSQSWRSSSLTGHYLLIGIAFQACSGDWRISTKDLGGFRKRPRFKSSGGWAVGRPPPWPWARGGQVWLDLAEEQINSTAWPSGQGTGGKCIIRKEEQHTLRDNYKNKTNV